MSEQIDPAALSAELTKLKAELTLRRGNLEKLSAVSADINSSLDLDKVLQTILETLEEHFGFQYSMLLLVEGSDDLVVSAAHGYKESVAGATVKIGVGPIGVAAKHKKILRNNSVAGGRRYVASAGAGPGRMPGVPPVAMGPGAAMRPMGMPGVPPVVAAAAPVAAQAPLPGLPDSESQVALPLVDKDTLIGVLVVESKQPMAFDVLDEMLLKTISNQMASAVTNARMHGYLKLLTDSYSRFVPHDFLNLLDKKSILDVALGNQIKRDMSILFSDVRSFTTLSESMTPEENFNFINGYLRRISPIIEHNKGVIDKYIGDAIMALFPGNAQEAVDAAIEMHQKVREYNFERQSKNRMPIKVGTGVHSGSLMLGTIGYHNRMDGTVISDSVNLCARLESLTKQYGANLLISGTVQQQLPQDEKYATRFLDRVIVKGKGSAIEVFEVLHADDDHTATLKKQTAKAFETALIHYSNKQFDACIMNLQLVIERNPADKAAELYLKRAQHYRADGVPDGWTGITKMAEK